jgi:hypothetical protein
MHLRSAVALTALTTVVWSLTPVARADIVQDQQYLDMVHSNGVGGSDDLLLAYAQKYCFGPVDWGMVGDLMGQIGWFNKEGVYVIQTAASRVYCSNKIAQPPAPPIIINRY